VARPGGYDPFNNSTVLRRSVEPGQYTAFRYTRRLADHGIARSIGTVADAYDNAMAESWVGTYKLELPGRPFKSRFDAELATVAYIGWYNHERLHSSLGDIPPVEYEALHLGSGVDEPQLQAVPAQAAPTDLEGQTSYRRPLSSTGESNSIEHVI
jgi:putative transposase